MSDEDERMDVGEDEGDDDAKEREEEAPSLGPAALGLHRVGTKIPAKRPRTKPLQTLNARGMPARLRKKKNFYDDHQEDVKPKLSPQKRTASLTKGLKRTAKQARQQTHNDDDDDDEDHDDNDDDDNDDEDEDEDFRPQRIKKERPSAVVPFENVVNFDTMSEKEIQLNTELVGRRLKNLLKLPKAHKFVMFEWFYSNLDQVLFKGENDFQVCLRDTFPQLAARQLSRVEWSMVRRMMGKPRRCSQAFFNEERRELERKRQKIRLLQSRKMADVSFVKHLPRLIPLPFQLGTKVTARLRRPQDGLFTGVIAAVDSITHHYRVTFDRQGLGTHTVPDFELMSMKPIDTIPITNLTQNIRKKKLATAFVANPLCALSRIDPVLNDSRHDPDDEEHMRALKEGLQVPGKESRVSVVGHPFKMIEIMVRTKKLLAAKSAKLKKLKQMNSDVAINKSYDEPITEEDQRQYANVIISLERINRQVHASLQEIQGLSRYLAREPHVASMLQPSFLREKCRQMGENSVAKHNEYSMTDSKILQLISDLSTIMWVTSYMSNNDQFSHVLRVLEGCVEEAKNHLDPENLDVFTANVMVHIHHIKMGVSRMHEGEPTAADDIIVEEEVVAMSSQVVGSAESDADFGIGQLVEYA